MEDYERVIDYLISNWPLSVADNFESIVNEKLDNLLQQPYMGIPSQIKPMVRSILLTKHNRLYYRNKDKTIEILNIIDTRQDPQKNPY